jgi:hypothetical protein
MSQPTVVGFRVVNVTLQIIVGCVKGEEEESVLKAVREKIGLDELAVTDIDSYEGDEDDILDIGEDSPDMYTPSFPKDAQCLTNQQILEDDLTSATERHHKGRQLKLL